MGIYEQVPRAMESLGNTITGITKDIAGEKVKAAQIRLQEINAEKDILATKADYALQEFRLTKDMQHQKALEENQKQRLALDREQIELEKKYMLPTTLRKFADEHIKDPEQNRLIKSMVPAKQLDLPIFTKDAWGALDDVRKTNLQMKVLEEGRERAIRQEKRDKQQHEEAMGLIALKKVKKGAKGSAQAQLLDKYIEAFGKEEGFKLFGQLKSKSPEDVRTSLILELAKKGYGNESAKMADDLLGQAGFGVVKGKTIKVGKPGSKKLSWRDFPITGTGR